MAFLFSLNASVVLTLSNNAPGVVKGRSEYDVTAVNENFYLVAYLDGYGRERISWWPESSLLPGI